MQYVLEWAMWIYMCKLKGKRSKKIKRKGNKNDLCGKWKGTE